MFTEKYMGDIKPPVDYQSKKEELRNYLKVCKMNRYITQFIAMPNQIQLSSVIELKRLYRLLLNLMIKFDLYVELLM